MGEDVNSRPSTVSLPSVLRWAITWSATALSLATTEAALMALL
ncbi:hypothetical protein ACN9WY_004761 [Salmonella enterica]